MLVAFWSAIAFCIGVILIYFSFLNYKKHKDFTRRGSPTQTAPIPLDPTPGQRGSGWRTGARGTPALEAQDDTMSASPPQYTLDENRKAASVGAHEEAARPGGDGSVDWDEEIW